MLAAVRQSIKNELIAALTKTKEAATPQEAVENLRLSYTSELKAALPDPTLLNGALDQIVRRVLRKQDIRMCMVGHGGRVSLWELSWKTG